MQPVTLRWKRRVFYGLLLACAAGSLALTRSNDPRGHGALSGVAPGPASSRAIALSDDGQYLWVVNTDGDSVSVFDVRDDAHQLIAQIPVGREPRTVALTSDYAFVASMVDGSVSVISTATYEVLSTTPVGTEPYGVAVAPNGQKVYVTNVSSNDISVLRTVPPFDVLRTIRLPGVMDPRGLAITADSSQVFVTEFFARSRPGALPGSDDEKEGRVTVLNGVTDAVIGRIALDPMADTGFNANGDALRRIPPPGNPPDPTRPPFNFVTGAFPNQLQSMVILGDRAYLPNTAASPNGPIRFNVNGHGFLSVINTVSLSHEAQNTINLNRGIPFEPDSPRKIFMTVPWDIAFKRQPRPDGVVEGWAVMMSSDMAVKVEVDLATGRPTINAPRMAGDPGNIRRIDVGSAPQGIVINSAGTRAYVNNYVSRDVSVLDLDNEQVIASLPSWPLPAPGTLERVVHEGKRLFFTARGPTFQGDFRMSRGGSSACTGCHTQGNTDQVTYIYLTGPRRGPDLANMFSHAPANRACAPTEPCSDGKYYDDTATADEVHDLEIAVRLIAGANDPRETRPVRGGLITLADRVTPEATGNIASFFSTSTPPSSSVSQQNAFRPQLEIFDGVQGIRALDAIARYIQLGVRGRISPVPPGDKLAAQGRLLFEQLNCVACHSGPKWTISRVITRPPAAADVQAGQFRPALRDVNTFNPAAPNEVTAVAGTPQGAFGYNPRPLLGLFANPDGFYHNASARSLDRLLTGEGCVTPASPQCVHNVSGRASPDERRALVQFLRSIDERTEPFPVP